MTADARTAHRRRHHLDHAQRTARWIGTRSELGPLLGVVILALAFQLSSDGKFLTHDQLSALTGFASGVGLVAIGVAILMISGEFDLSVSQTYAIAPVIMGVLATRSDFPLLPALLIALLVVAFIGVVNGFLVIVGRIPSFITTLGMLFVLTTASLELAETNPPEITESDSPLLTALGGEVPHTPFAAPFLWFVGVGAVLALIIARTTYGNWTRAVGDRRGAAARAMGVPVARVKLINFTLCAVLAGFAGCLEFSYFRRAEVHAGENYNLLAIVAAVIGGTSLFGVRGTLIGTILGGIVLGALNSGLVLTGVDQQYYTGIIGVIFLVAAFVNWRVEVMQRGSGLPAILRRR
jgi:simple sugar transport system permease protein